MTPEDDLVERVALAQAIADEQNGAPPWGYIVSLGKHATEPHFDRARAAIAECEKGGNLAREVQNNLRRIADLLDTLQKYREEYENPVPDYTLRRTLRDRLFSLAAAAAKPEG